MNNQNPNQAPTQSFPHDVTSPAPTQLHISKPSIRKPYKEAPNVPQPIPVQVQGQINFPNK